MAPFKKGMEKEKCCCVHESGQTDGRTDKKEIHSTEHTQRKSVNTIGKGLGQLGPRTNAEVINAEVTNVGLDKHQSGQTPEWTNVGVDKRRRGQTSDLTY